ncbi:isoprenylcysteine carboxyl methyltransferase [Dulcicalothrix desertica PCC 7102]|uniref:Isoprenylcysteine carboxyl methyltransferase n=1 Tax=Dulcicalothrix desertica PCC 7102 TaxID=232991 RepID=A0A3S1CIV1_9CYAN|nr:isoprenylcysteine carboxylmethyltransferase family protein [Dulcicalothrix desertica]RUT04366.1 isoprenylcysteine carboxyl methyltransferase [Dulcicalothrix desertica PCC 7102]TWH51221.1 protein-S-isoprenylcysteine O-methyltransferase Ste14 [Dulcicalothrix desertica PCC 7102]
MVENVWTHYGRWWAVIVWIIMYGLFLAFIPFYKKSQSKPASVYLAFIVAFALEMFGIPMSLYFVTWLFGFTLPEGFLWGHTLVKYIGFWGMYVGLLLSAIGALMVILGWKEIYRRYWSKKEGRGRLVTKGIYAYIRHPQYTGFLLITLGMLVEWVTIPLLIMYPILIVLYYRLAKKEERDMEREFGREYIEYKRRTSMFLPLPKIKQFRRTNTH